jgi:hypothetical protein
VEKAEKREVPLNFALEFFIREGQENQLGDL